MIRQLALCAVLCLFAAASYGQATPPPPAHPITAEQVKQLMTITHSVDRMNETVHNMITQQKTALPYFPEAFWTDFEAGYAKLDWIALATPIYQKYLSEEDAAKAITFYSTDAGQRALNAGMAMTTEMAQVGFEQGRAIGARLGEKYQKEIQENMRKAQQSSGTTVTK
jgi:hypothetical protein